MSDGLWFNLVFFFVDSLFYRLKTVLALSKICRQPKHIKCCTFAVATIVFYEVQYNIHIQHFS